MKRVLVTFLLLLSASLLGSTDAYKGGSGGAANVFAGSQLLNEQGLAWLYETTQLENLAHLTTQVWVDPWNGSDATGDGSFLLPWRSFWKIKDQCLSKSYSRCTVKGSDHSGVFGARMYTLDYDAGAVDMSPFVAGETLTWTNPAGTGTVVAAYQNKIVVATVGNAGTEATITSTFTGSAALGVRTATVTAVADTITGYPDIIITEAELAEAGAGDTTITPTLGHPYADGDGPFLLYQAAGTAAATGLTLGTTQVYICEITGSTSFELDLDAACTGASLDFTDDGTGDLQLIAAHITYLGGTDLGVTTGIDLGCADNNKICSLLEPEESAFPWLLDADGKFPGGAMATIVPGFWSAVADYKTALGGVFLAIDASDVGGGWLGLQNGIIQNMSHDCLTAGSDLGGGRILALNIKCLNIRNGAGDRSTLGHANRGYFAHNTTAGVNGEATPDAIVDGIIVAVNFTGSNEMGGTGASAGSGSVINPNNNGAIRLLLGGGVVTATPSCAGTGGDCHAPTVLPGADFVVVGPGEMRNTTTQPGNYMFYQDTSGDTNYTAARMLFNQTDTAAINRTGFVFSKYSGTGTGYLRLFESTIRLASTQPRFFFACPVTSGDFVIEMKDILVDQIGSGFTYASIDDCGVATHVEAVINTTANFEGVFDSDDASITVNGIDFNGTNRSLVNFRSDIATVLTANSLPTTQWRFFEDNTLDSGGVGVNGNQWGTDTLFRVQPGKEGYEAGVSSYTVDLRTIYGSDPNASCLPDHFGLGQRVCGVRLTSNHMGGR